MSEFSKAFGSFGGFLGNTAYASASNGIGNFLSGVSGLLFGGKQAEREWQYKQKEMALQQEYNQQNMQKQYDYQLDFWNKQNQYNDPSNAVARWRTAGVSPMAVFGSSPGGAGVAGGSVSVPNSENPNASGVGGRASFAPSMTLAEASQVRNQQRMTDANVELLAAEARLKRSQAVNQEWENTLQPTYERRLEALTSAAESDAAKKAIEAAWLPFQNAMQMALSSADLKLKNESLNKFLAEIDELKSRKVLNDELANKAKEEARNLAALTKTEDEMRPWKVENQIRDVQLKASETAFNWYKKEILGPAEKSKIDADSELARKRAKMVDDEIERLGKLNNYTDEQIKYLKHLRALGWAKFGVSTLLGISAEARGWFKEGSKAGAAANWAVDDEALGAIAATL